MQYANTIFKNNKQLPISKYKMRCQSKSKDYYIALDSIKSTIGFQDIRKILSFPLSIKSSLSFVPVRIDLGNRVFEDKFTYILLESIIHTLIEECKCRIEIIFNCAHNIYNEGIQHSCLIYSGIDKEKRKKFLTKYLGDIRGTHFRRILSPDGPSQQISLLAQDIDSFLKFNSIVDDCRNKIGLIVAELADNALEHASAQCLVDIDITKDYFKMGEVVNDGIYRGVNIVAMNYSETLLGNLLKEKFHAINDTDISRQPQYSELIRAYNYHSQNWNEKYREEDFFALASFQDKISGRKNYCTGGKGLTELLNMLEIRSDSYYCYCITGNRIITLSKEYICCEENSWVGFNRDKNFFTALPDKDCLKELPFNFPGTAYNLNFVLKQEETL